MGMLSAIGLTGKGRAQPALPMSAGEASCLALWACSQSLLTVERLQTGSCLACTKWRMKGALWASRACCYLVA